MTPTKTKVVCQSAKSRWYQTGGIYTLYTDGKENYVQGSDGFYDNVTKCLSVFKEYKGETKQQKGKRKNLAAVGKGSNPEETPKS